MVPRQDVTCVLMTRFNMASPGKESQIRERPGWLEGRFDLFERYCLPSIAAQTSHDFHWIIYFDQETPQPFRDRIEACRRIFPFVPYYCGYFSAAGWGISLRETFPEPTPWLLTTRLDSDDGLAVDFMARLRAAVDEAAPTRSQSFNFTNGIILHDGRTYALSHRSNAFGSWFEPWDDKTRAAMSIRHMEMAKAGPVRQIDGPAAWLQVIHETNVSNKVRGRRIAPETVRGRFPDAVLGPLRPANALGIAVENLVLGTYRDRRDALVAWVRGQERVSG